MAPPALVSDLCLTARAESSSPSPTASRHQRDRDSTPLGGVHSLVYCPNVVKCPCSLPTTQTSCSSSVKVVGPSFQTCPRSLRPDDVVDKAGIMPPFGQALWRILGHDLDWAHSTPRSFWAFSAACLRCLPRPPGSSRAMW